MISREFTPEDMAGLAGENCAFDAIELMLGSDDPKVCAKNLRNSLLELRGLPYPEDACLGFARRMYGFMVPGLFDGLPAEIKAAGEQAGAAAADDCMAKLTRKDISAEEAVRVFRNTLIDLNTACVHPGPAFIGFSASIAPMMAYLIRKVRSHRKDVQA